MLFGKVLQRELVEADAVVDFGFFGFFAVFVDVDNVAWAVGDAEGAVDATAFACHAFEKVFDGAVGLEFGQGHVALVKAAHGAGFDAFDTEVFGYVLYALSDAAGLGEDAAVEGSVVEGGVFEFSRVNVAGVDEGLEFFEGHDGVDGAVGFLEEVFHFLAGAGSDEDYFGSGVGALDELCGLDHGRGGGRDVFDQFGVAFFDEGYEGGAAAGGHDAFFFPLVGFFVEGDVGAEGGFDYLVEAEHFDGGDHLMEAAVATLAYDGGCDDGVDAVAGVVLGFAEDFDDVEDEGFVLDGAEGALIDAGATGDALVVVDHGRALLVDGDGLGFAALHAGAVLGDDGAVGAGFGALAAFDTLGFVDGGAVVDDGDGVFGADLGAGMHEAATAGGCDEHAAYGAFVAGDVDYLDGVGVGFVASHGHLDALLDDGALFVDAAAELGFGTGADGLGYVYVDVFKIVVVGMLDDLFQYVVFD